MFFNISQNLRENIYAGVSFSITLQAEGLHLRQVETPEQVFYCELKIFRRANFIKVYERLLPKSKIFSGVPFRKASSLYLFYNEGTGRYIYLKIPQLLSFSKFFWVVAFENIPENKNIFKVDDKKDTTTVPVNIIW